MSKKPISVEIKLTKGQTEKLQPIFDQAKKAYKEGKPGAILMQPFQVVYEPGGFLEAGFIPHDTAKKLRRVMNGYLKSLKRGE